MLTCAVVVSLGYPEIISWRMIFRHRNHLSQTKSKSCPCSTNEFMVMDCEIVEKLCSIVCISFFQRFQVYSNNCEAICKTSKMQLTIQKSLSKFLYLEVMICYQHIITQKHDNNFANEMNKEYSRHKTLPQLPP